MADTLDIISNEQLELILPSTTNNNSFIITTSTLTIKKMTGAEEAVKV